MAKLTKGQKRTKKVREKKKLRNSEQQRQAAAAARLVARANARIMEAVEVAVARAVNNWHLPDVQAREMVADMLRDHLFTDAPVDKPAKAPPVKKEAPAFDKAAWQAGASANHCGDATDVLDVLVGFDKKAWGQG